MVLISGRLHSVFWDSWTGLGNTIACETCDVPVFVFVRYLSLINATRFITKTATGTMALQALYHKVMGPLSTFYKRQVAHELAKTGKLLGNPSIIH